MDKTYITLIAAGSRLGTASAQNLGFYTTPTSESQNLEFLAKSLVSNWVLSSFMKLRTIVAATAATVTSGPLFGANEIKGNVTRVGDADTADNSSPGILKAPTG